MLERENELREDVLDELEKYRLDGYEFIEKVIDMIVLEFGEKLESYEFKHKYTVGRTSKTYKKMLLQSIKYILKINKNVNFQDESGYSIFYIKKR